MNEAKYFITNAPPECQSEQQQYENQEGYVTSPGSGQSWSTVVVLSLDVGGSHI